MASDQTGNKSARILHRMTLDYGTRAAAALNDLLPTRHRDKEVARRLKVSVRMAKYLRSGRHWTEARLTQARAAFGDAFDIALYSPVSSAQHDQEMADLAARLERLEACFAQVARGGDARLASAEGDQTDGPGVREIEPRSGGRGAATRGEGGAVGASSAAAGRKVKP